MGDIIAEMIFGALLYPQGDMHVIGHNAIGIHGDYREIFGELVDEIGNYPSEGAPFHIGATGKTGRNARIADDMAEGFGVCRFFENNMIIAGSVIIMIALAAGVSMGEIGLIRGHDFIFSC